MAATEHTGPDRGSGTVTKAQRAAVQGFYRSVEPGLVAIAAALVDDPQPAVLEAAGRFDDMIPDLATPTTRRAGTSCRATPVTWRRSASRSSAVRWPWSDTRWVG